MSTRATYEFRDGTGSYTVYKHHDGYPRGGYQWIANALPHAWPLPRFEADEFAAAFVRGNKVENGGIRLTAGRDAHGDTEFHYVIQCVGGKIRVERFIAHRNWKADTCDWALAQVGFLDDMLDQHAPEREWIVS